MCVVDIINRFIKDLIRNHSINNRNVVDSRSVTFNVQINKPIKFKYTCHANPDYRINNHFNDIKEISFDHTNKNKVHIIYYNSTCCVTYELQGSIFKETKHIGDLINQYIDLGYYSVYADNEFMFRLFTELGVYSYNSVEYKMLYLEYLRKYQNFYIVE